MTDATAAPTTEAAAPLPPPAEHDDFEFLKGIETQTSDGPADLPAAPAPAPEAAPAPADPPPKPRPAWVTWTEEGGFKVAPGDGLAVDENGEVTLSPDVIGRVSSKRIAAARREERERAASQIEAARREAAEAKAAIDLLRGGAKPEAPPAKPWAAKGAEKPKIDQFDDVDQWADARDEWAQAQRAPDDVGPAKSDDPQPVDDVLAGRIRDLYAEGVSSYPDFGEVAGPVQLTDEVLFAVADSDFGAELLYYLGGNPEQAETINSLSGPGLLRSLARIEARIELSNSPSGAGNSASSAAAHRASPVIKPVRTGASPRQNPVDIASMEDKGPFFQALRDQGI